MITIIWLATCHIVTPLYWRLRHLRHYRFITFVTYCYAIFREGIGWWMDRLYDKQQAMKTGHTELVLIALIILLRCYWLLALLLFITLLHMSLLPYCFHVIIGVRLASLLLCHITLPPLAAVCRLLSIVILLFVVTLAGLVTEYIIHYHITLSLLLHIYYYYAVTCLHEYYHIVWFTIWWHCHWLALRAVTMVIAITTLPYWLYWFTPYAIDYCHCHTFTITPLSSLHYHGEIRHYYINTLRWLFRYCWLF